ncbi:ABC transporter ATP-binding protein [Gilvimarinus sp. F26214L]|uniref:ABC transporter ATP-binding protein n=1 Tax=Gilvimarinus sp. DZF01 TaxID=3461371 RepID=UPI0040454928
MSEPLLQLEQFSVSLRSAGRDLNLVDQVSLSLDRNQTLGIVGESGSGKSTLALSLMRLHEKRDRPRYSGTAMFDGRDLLALSDGEMRSLRGREISMILQDPMTSLNPVFSIGNQIREAIRCHGQVPAAELAGRVVESLRRVSIPAPGDRVRDYPHQLSGGMRQRVVGGIAISCEPRLLIADEPTTSLDVTIQAQYLQLLQDIQRSMGLSILLITHDFGVVAKMCDRVCVMYGGTIVEDAPVGEIFDRPAHPYTHLLMGSRPSINHKPHRLVSIPGAPPKPGDVTSGCRFAPRCDRAREQCRRERPPVQSAGRDHRVRCWYPVLDQDGAEPIRGPVEGACL